jgi:hypothetical protein
VEAEEWTQWVTAELLNQKYALVELGMQFVPVWGAAGFQQWCDAHGWEIDIIPEPDEAQVTDAIERILTESEGASDDSDNNQEEDGS